MTYISLVYRHYSSDTEEHDTLEDAIKFIENGEDYGHWFGVAVIHENKMVWFNDFITKEEAQKKVDKHLLTIKP